MQAGYRSSKALNRYDCRNGSFSTIKRVYLDKGFASDSRRAGCRAQVMTAAPRSVDERLWYEVCKPPSVDELQKVAAEAGRAANPDMEPGATRHARLSAGRDRNPARKRWSRRPCWRARRTRPIPAEPSAPRPPLIKLPPPPPAAQPAPPPLRPPWSSTRAQARRAITPGSQAGGGASAQSPIPAGGGPS